MATSSPGVAGFGGGDGASNVQVRWAAKLFLILKNHILELCLLARFLSLLEDPIEVSLLGGGR